VIPHHLSAKAEERYHQNKQFPDHIYQLTLLFCDITFHSTTLLVFPLHFPNSIVYESFRYPNCFCLRDGFAHIRLADRNRSTISPSPSVSSSSHHKGYPSLPPLNHDVVPLHKKAMHAMHVHLLQNAVHDF